MGMESRINAICDKYEVCNPLSKEKPMHHVILPAALLIFVGLYCFRARIR
jgi:hypothetical protein